MSDANKNKLNKITLLLLVLFLFFSGWFAAIYLPGRLHGKSTVLLSEVYGVVALVGGIYGLSIAKNWGTFRSYFGKAIILLSLGLLLQEFGQLAYSYLNSVKHVAVPYPSYPDIGFFGSIPVYIFAALYLAKGLGVVNIIKKKPVKLMFGIVIPLFVLAISYWFFLKGYTVAGKSHASIFFDFAYPIGQAIYVSVALVTLLCVSRLLGGVMKYPVLLLLLAFIVQYASDFNFLYQTLHGTWAPGRYGDYIYFLAYCVMTYSLIRLNGGLKLLMHPKREKVEEAV
ncbi:MAG TPA: hypothetical protein VLF90_01235 [Patescibacteria group bacterium]|nr:hypothetical protein [Patescibacteria group bacterium]